MSELPKQRKWYVWHGDLFWADPAWKERLAEIGLKADKDWTRLTSEDPVSSSFRTTNNFRFNLRDNTTIYFKRYVYRRFRFKHWLQPAKAATEAAGFNDLRNLNIPTLTPIAYGERRRLGLLRAAFIVTIGIENTRELDNYLAREWFRLSYSQKKPVLEHLQDQLIVQLQRCHQAGFYHWDLKLRNILIKGEPTVGELIWIDCPRSRWLAANHPKGVLADLAAMARVGIRVLSPGQRMRFLLAYTNNDRVQARLLYKDIAKALLKRPARPYWQLLAKDDPQRAREKNRQASR